MSVDELLHELRTRAITLQPYHGTLRATGETLQLDEGLKAGLQRHKLELMVLLGENLEPRLALAAQLAEAIQHALLGTDIDEVVAEVHVAREHGLLLAEETEVLAEAAAAKRLQVPARIEDMPLDDLATSKLVREVFWESVGETVIWAADNAVIPSSERRVVYSASELRLLKGAAREWLHAIYFVKREFNGVVEEHDEDSIVIPSSAFHVPTEVSDDRCYGCGQSKWLRNENGPRVCEVCHPRPLSSQQTSTA